MNLTSNKYNLFFNQFKFNSSTVTIFKKENAFFVRGPLGVLLVEIPTAITIKRLGSDVVVCGKYFQKELILTFSKILMQTVRGVEFGFFDILLIKGIG